ncbi:glycosyltransferase family protein [Rhizobium gallicum]|uniref:Glycosyltransferase family protein n=1 Tax=Rhizobium gallicum TaxID=56730 RepID=A0A1L5NLQ2_9HYPH|nr:glycosyltransferase family 92 protein [Rhizobium gallicum]APO68808.1 glycosyltransferase family protein [Rhizobium gallicum]
MSWFRRKNTPINSLAIIPPKPVPGRSGIAIAVIVKDEASYIEEWAMFHKAVGISHFLVYDNGSTDATCGILQSVLTAGELTIIPWSGKMYLESRFINSQVLAFSHAVCTFGGRFSRIAFIDVDEFLLPRKGGSIEEALEATQGFPNVSLPWHMFGTGGHKVRPQGPVVMNYTWRNDDPLSKAKHLSNFKCIVDPCEVVEVTVHQFKTRSFGDLTVNDAGFRTTRDGRKKRSFYSNEYLQLNHYYCKSAQEMAEKIARGSDYIVSADFLKKKMETTRQNIEASLVEDRSMVEFVTGRSIPLSRPEISSVAPPSRWQSASPNRDA